jgi:TRAP transporter TAXI family solute receptor
VAGAALQAAPGRLGDQVGAAVLALALLLAACTPLAPRPTPAAPSQPAASGATLHLGCPPLGTAEAQYCRAIRDVLAMALPGAQVTARPSGGPREQLSRLALGELDLVWVRQDLGYLAYHGQGPWQGQPIRDYRLLWLYALQPLLLAVRADSGITTLSQLDGAPFVPGARDGETAGLTREILEALTIAPRYVELKLEDTIAAVQTGQAVGFAKLARTADKPDGLIAHLERTTALRVLSFGEAERARLHSRRPALSWATIPPGTYAQATSAAALVTVAHAYGFAARAALPDDVAYALVRAVHADAMAGRDSRQASAFPDTKDSDLAALTAAAINTPLHPGALRAYRERGLALPPATVPRS